MGMFNPPHPGVFIRETYVAPCYLSIRKMATSLPVSPSTLNRLLNRQSNISPEMALRPSKAPGRSPVSWLPMQDQDDLWHARKNVNLKQVKKLDMSGA